MSNMAEKDYQRKMRLQLQSIESPSNLPTRRRPRFTAEARPFRPLVLSGSETDSPLKTDEARKTSEEEGDDVCLTPVRRLDLLSPVTNLAHNLFDTNLSTPPSLKLTKKRLSLDNCESSPSPRVSSSASPLKAITNKFLGKSGSRGITKHRTAPHDLEANKENIPVPMFEDSPCKVEPDPKEYKLKMSKEFKLKMSSWRDRMGPSSRIVQSPEKEKIIPIQAGNTVSQKRPLFNVVDDENSKDSGYSSQPIEDNRHRKKI